MTAATPPADRIAPSHLPIYCKLTAVALLWGGTFIAGRLLAESLAPSVAATGRFAVAVLLLLVLTWRVEGGLPRLTLGQTLTTFALGATGVFLYNISFFAALSQMPAGRTALFVALNPIVTALLLAALFREPLGLRKWTGILIAFCGAAVVISRGDLLGAVRDIGSAVGKGELFMLCAVTSWAAYTLIGRYALRGLSPLVTTTYATLWGLLLLGIGAIFDPAPLQLGSLNWQQLVAILYLGAGGTVIGFVWYYQGVQAIGPARTAVFNNLVPVFGVLLATLLLDEPLTLAMLVGGALTIGGVMLTNRSAR
ncbi:DMT family transporter [Stutzerimonas azotifigens]|uniref:DMT family transporter n=1 Tax=Stutzerimonas azotifigens TaxID=291995 RepID=A0ABR5YWA9_9GAMM|nr:DMT family transporter [Stutzerimonas azotifigens]MBA1272211.1 DMT family transporter [Stutzerimonas azotifigens]